MGKPHSKNSAKAARGAISPDKPLPGFESSKREISPDETSAYTSCIANTETSVQLSTSFLVAILALASVVCIFSFVVAVVVSERRLQGPTATPEDVAIFVDPIRFVARQEPDVVTASCDEATGLVASTVWPEIKVGVQVDGDPTRAGTNSPD